ncbi:hypothetical protein E3U55_03100 [Filobacillus milosensis]|uniref:Type II secretion system protein GspF domain-containing protein n=1 Tax=Filobacillus milosensis TaxID=94137 RepID=A0A4Y8IQ79_9BACI|nr:type II secretion system F family protein [Filobacillus milosensis]TFB23814.1 hypothetical protein E3U55_03100 [Filobacillus milosensis]
MRLAILPFRYNTFPIKEQIDFLDRLSRLLIKQYTMKQALEFMKYDPQFKVIANEFSNLLQKGTTIDECFRKLSFHPIVISFINFSNESGHISEHIINCNRLLKIKAEFQKKFLDVLKYPLLLIFISVLIIIGLNIYLMPMFKNTFNTFGSADALKFFQMIVHSINVFTTILLMLLFFLIATLAYMKKQSIPKKIRVISQLPVIKYYYSLLISLQFSYQLYALLESGKTIQESLKLIRSQNELKLISYFAKIIVVNLSHGKSLYESFKSLSLIQDEMKWLINRSDDTGTLSRDLYHYANLLLDVLEDKTRKTLLMIQPISFVVVGAIVITIYILTIFPVYQLMKHL